MFMCIFIRKTGAKMLCFTNQPDIRVIESDHRYNIYIQITQHHCQEEKWTENAIMGDYARKGMGQELETMHTSREWRKKDCFTNQDNRKRLLRENTQGSKQRKINKYKTTKLDKACIQTNAPMSDSYCDCHIGEDIRTDGRSNQ